MCFLFHMQESAFLVRPIGFNRGANVVEFESLDIKSDWCIRSHENENCREHDKKIGSYIRFH